MRFDKKKICALALTGALAVSALSVGYASWKTDITANGNVSASGKWDVKVTEADIKLSTGTALSETNYELTRASSKEDNTIIASISEGTWVEDEALIGTQSETPFAATTHFYAVDTTKFDVTDVVNFDRNTVAADETTIKLSDYLNKYYRNVQNQYSEENSKKWATMVMDGFLRDTDALLQEKFPDTYKNYAVISLLVLPSPDTRYVIAKYDEVETEKAVISEDGASVSYADLTFGLPGSWAQYSLTVENNGTVNANLSDAVIELETESSQLTLEKPDLEDEVLKPGDSCTITFVVQVPESITDDLDATGTLTVKLPYSQTAVEAAPSASHTHN